MKNQNQLAHKIEIPSQTFQAWLDPGTNPSPLVSLSLSPLTLLSSRLASCSGQAFSHGNTQHPTGKRVCLSDHSYRSPQVESHWPAGSLPILETGLSPKESAGTVSRRRMIVGAEQTTDVCAQPCGTAHKS